MSGDQSPRSSDYGDLQPLLVELIPRLRKIGPVRELMGTPWEGYLTVAQRLGGFDPNLLSAMPTELAEHVWRALAEDESPEVREHLLTHPDCPAAILEMLAADVNLDVRAGVAAHPACDAGLLRELFEAGNFAVRLTVLAHRHCPQDILRARSESQHQGVLSTIARNPASPADVLRRLSGSRHLHVLISLAGNPACTPEILDALASSIIRDFPIASPTHETHSSLAYRMHSVLAIVADNPSCPRDLSRRVIADLARGDDHQRKLAASVTTCPGDVLRRLARRCSPDIREAIAYNPNCPLDVLERLAADRDTDVRDYVAQNPSAPEQVLAMLADDKSPRVRNLVAMHGNCSEATRKRIFVSLSGSANPEFRGAAAGNCLCPPESLASLAQDEDETVRGALVHNPSAPPHLLPALWNDSSEYVRQRTRVGFDNIERLNYAIDDRRARHHDTPPEDLLRLASSGFYSIRLAALRNAAFPVQRRANLAAGVVAGISAWFGAARTAAPPLNLADVAVALHALNLGKAPSELRTRASLSRSRDWLRRAAAVFLADPSSRSLLRLARDENGTVRFLARQRLGEAPP